MMPLITLAITNGTTIIVSRLRNISPPSSNCIANPGAKTARRMAATIATAMYKVRWLFGLSGIV